mmetsp:Transcript_2620/g.7324  ORF Transcript_2620/g.7324 Transcript_2620/m.7324 type:complete len:89 (-) Transcript_2620:329-595(-)
MAKRLLVDIAKILARELLCMQQLRLSELLRDMSSDTETRWMGIIFVFSAIKIKMMSNLLIVIVVIGLIWCNVEIGSFSACKRRLSERC